MSADTSIEWTHRPGTRPRTWNPTRGCSRISPGCEKCYAEQIAARFSKPGLAFHGFATRNSKGEGRWTRKLALLDDDAVEAPLRWREPSTVFVNSMSDLFHEDLSYHEIDRVFAVMLLSPRHTFIILTKRAERMRSYMNDPNLYKRVLIDADKIRTQRPELAQVGISNPTTHPASWIWLGVSIENQEYADERIPHLLATPASVKILSCEPLLGDIDLGEALDEQGYESCGPAGWIQTRERGVDWVLVGGESGRGAREFDLDWARSLVRQCRDARIPVFMKQLGSHAVTYGCASKADCTHPDCGPSLVKLRSKKGGDQREWPKDLQGLREFPVALVGRR